mmetsp:Transcript_21335/g.44421  ORF Transcript_21335/g.44421 Transcript_21335/m.44421 type:complete len:189 (-) Transcript_21335:69-635(-)
MVRVKNRYVTLKIIFATNNSPQASIPTLHDPPPSTTASDDGGGRHKVQYSSNAYASLSQTGGIIQSKTNSKSKSVSNDVPNEVPNSVKRKRDDDSTTSTTTTTPPPPSITPTDIYNVLSTLSQTLFGTVHSTHFLSSLQVRSYSRSTQLIEIKINRPSLPILMSTIFTVTKIKGQKCNIVKVKCKGTE